MRQPIFHRFEGKNLPPFLKFNERLVRERFPTTAMGFPQDQTRPTISFVEAAHVSDGKFNSREISRAPRFLHRGCVSRSSTTSSGGLKGGVHPRFLNPFSRSPLGSSPSISRGRRSDRCGCAASTSSSLRPFHDSRDLGMERAICEVKSFEGIVF